MKSRKIIKLVVGSLTGGALILSGLALQNVVTPTTSQNQTDTVQAQGSASEFEETIMKAVEKAKDSVVSIQNYQKESQQNNLYGYGTGGENQVDLEDPSASQKLAGEGSGVIYKIDGDTAYLVTNNHVVENADSLKVKLADGTTEDGELVGRDVVSDLAVVKISSKNVKSAIKFADSDATKVGSIAIAIGSPLGSKFSNSVTQGIISGQSRIVPMDLNKDGQADIETTLIQTSAAINPGNSGGALLNKDGDLVGINSSKFSNVDVEGMGFAIPSKEVQRVIAQLEKDGKVTRPFIGISQNDLANITSRSKTEILKLKSDQTDGVVVTDTVKGSPAETAGLKKYDVITKIGDKEIKNILELRRELYAYNVGDKVELTVLREGKETKVQVTLGAQPEQQSNNNLQQYQQGQQGQEQENGQEGQEGQTPRLPFPGQR
ncbi:trypsin-like peptidase domain-containing protein [Abiotrophia defectiva]|uniref:S1C family serine protease n=1 Tax=Abiotrophia defectiva TaxID=46125 RepID=UPI00227F86EE|nr:trypsin-like peptidase domain-containing protein [Abiotrophia defectiva]MCY7225219.1 trypsin-like peptidase domain-containing protein [Abiotrophia defectiva]